MNLEFDPGSESPNPYSFSSAPSSPFRLLPPSPSSSTSSPSHLSSPYNYAPSSPFRSIGNTSTSSSSTHETTSALIHQQLHKYLSSTPTEPAISSSTTNQLLKHTNGTSANSLLNQHTYQRASNGMMRKSTSALIPPSPLTISREKQREKLWKRQVAAAERSLHSPHSSSSTPTKSRSPSLTLVPGNKRESTPITLSPPSRRPSLSTLILSPPASSTTTPSSPLPLRRSGSRIDIRAGWSEKAEAEEDILKRHSTLFSPSTSASPLPLPSTPLTPSLQSRGRVRRTYRLFDEDRFHARFSEHEDDLADLDAVFASSPSLNPLSPLPPLSLSSRGLQRKQLGTSGSFLNSPRFTRENSGSALSSSPYKNGGSGSGEVSGAHSLLVSSSESNLLAVASSSLPFGGCEMFLADRYHVTDVQVKVDTTLSEVIILFELPVDFVVFERANSSGDILQENQTTPIRREGRFHLCRLRFRFDSISGLDFQLAAWDMPAEVFIELIDRPIFERRVFQQDTDNSPLLYVQPSRVRWLPDPSIANHASSPVKRATPLRKVANPLVKGGSSLSLIPSIPAGLLPPLSPSTSFSSLPLSPPPAESFVKELNSKVPMIVRLRLGHVPCVILREALLRDNTYLERLANFGLPLWTRWLRLPPRLRVTIQFIMIYIFPLIALFHGLYGLFIGYGLWPWLHALLSSVLLAPILQLISPIVWLLTVFLKPMIPLWNLLKVIWSLFAAGIAPFVWVLQSTILTTANTVTAIIKPIGAIITPLFKALSIIFEPLLRGLSILFEPFLKAINTLFGPLFRALSNISGPFKQVFNTASTATRVASQGANAASRTVPALGKLSFWGQITSTIWKVIRGAIDSVRPHLPFISKNFNRIQSNTSSASMSNQALRQINSQLQLNTPPSKKGVGHFLREVMASCFMTFVVFRRELGKRPVIASMLLTFGVLYLLGFLLDLAQHLDYFDFTVIQEFATTKMGVGQGERPS